MRKIVLDIETTGLSHSDGDRITEIGCVEIIDNEPTGNEFQIYINPEKIVSEESVSITGLTNDFLQNKPKFIEIIDDLLGFIGNDPIIAHNASFDIGFINNELEKIGYKNLNNTIIDTLEVARKRFSGNNSLNGLCKRYKISLSGRNLHGALLDAKLLAKVYGCLSLETEDLSFFSEELNEERFINFNRKMIIKLSQEEEEAHKNFLKNIKGD